MEVVQLNLFDDIVQEPDLVGQAPLVTSINGFYYERSSDKFVSFSLGSRHFEISATECEFPKEWQKRIKADRAI